MGTQPHSSSSPLSAHAYCGQTVAHLSNCWALVHRTMCLSCTFSANFTTPRVFVSPVGGDAIGMSANSVVSSEISGNFPWKISGNFRKFLEEFFAMSISYFQVQWCCKISMFLINNSPDISALTWCIMFRKNNLFLWRLPGYQRSRMKIWTL